MPKMGTSSVHPTQPDENSSFYEDLISSIKQGDKTKLNKKLKSLRRKKNEETLKQFSKYGATVLCDALIHTRDRDILSEIADMCPESLNQYRVDPAFKGQTPLHITITQRDCSAAEHILSLLNKNSRLKKDALHMPATGYRFINTTMMGELPLTVAALTFEPEMVEKLLKHGSEIDRRNSKGDTVFHSLVEFAAVYPDEETVSQVIKMMTYLVDYILKPTSEVPKDASFDITIWFAKNNLMLTPFQLAAKYGLVKLCQHILGIPGLYQIIDSHDGIFDIKQYDITEIDPIATLNLPESQNVSKLNTREFEGISEKRVKSISNNLDESTDNSILEIVFEIVPSSAFNLIETPPVKRVIEVKWEFYKCIYIIWGLIHLVFMAGYTFYAVVKSGGNQKNTNSEIILKAYAGIAFLFSVIYGAQEIIRMARENTIIHQEQKLRKCIHRNGFFRGILFLFALFSFADSICTISDSNADNIPIIFALVFGWWFQIFFLRGWLKFSFFTVMIHKVILGDLFRFSVIIVIMLIAYSGAMFAVFQGSEVADTVFDSYEGAMMIMFKLLLGLGDMEAFHKAKHPWLATALFVLFVALTYVLLLNALIAMMSNTCNSVSENRNSQWRMQQLAVILFFEGIFPFRLVKQVGQHKPVKRYDPIQRTCLEETRTYLEVHSLRKESADTDKPPLFETIQTSKEHVEPVTVEIY